MAFSMTIRLKKIRRDIKKKLGMRTQRPCFEGKYYWQARRMLLDVVDIFNEAELPYTLDAGTLLGIARDGDLIPWDNDLDMMLPVDSIPDLRKLYGKIHKRGWKVSRTYTMPFASAAWKAGQPRVIKIRSRNLLYFGPGSTLLDITIIYKHEGYYWWEMAKHICRIPASFIDSVDEVGYAGISIKVPHPYKQYLERTYGDWRTPRPDFPRDEFGIVVR